MSSLRLVQIALLLYPIAAGYYHMYCSNNEMQTECEKRCNEHGRYLTSIHTQVQANNINNQCVAVNYTCWIGLNIQFINNHTVFYWTDNSEIDESFIKQYWCNGYPLIDHNYTNNVYIDPNNNCWKSAPSSSSLSMYGICGPQMFDLTGYMLISSTIIPSFVCLVTTIYSVYCAIFLIYHLFIFEHNWLDVTLEPTKPIKITAVLLPVLGGFISILFLVYSIMLYAAYRMTGIINPGALFSSDYPYIYSQLDYLYLTVIILVFFYLPIGYIHILLRLKHVFDNNSIMEQNVMPSPRLYYYVIISMITILFVLPIIYSAMNQTVSEHKVLFTVIVFAVYGAVDMSINSLLLFLYIKGLHKYSHIQYFRIDEVKQNMNSSHINSRQHELMVEATRYTVLFSMVLIYNILLLFSMLATYSNHKEVLSYQIHQYPHNVEYQRKDYIFKTILFTFSYGKEILLLIAIQLSFKFSHSQYEKLCFRCDKRVKKYCHTMVKRKGGKILRAYELTELQRPLL